MEVEEMVGPITEFEEKLYEAVEKLEKKIGKWLDYGFVMLQHDMPEPGKPAIFASLGNVKPVEKACGLLRMAADQMESRAPDVHREIPTDEDEGSVH